MERDICKECGEIFWAGQHYPYCSKRCKQNALMRRAEAEKKELDVSKKRQ